MRANKNSSRKLDIYPEIDLTQLCQDHIAMDELLVLGTELEKLKT
jgi:hypothetical protein